MKHRSNTMSNPLLWAIFVAYCIVLGYTAMHHELWGDEIHSWNIVKASNTFSDLISNIRYEGHPPVWYAILWPISKLSHDITYVQLAQLTIAALILFLVLFFSPFPFVIKLLIPFGYYFLFEYGVLSRNYAIGVLPACCICLILHKSFRFKIPLYYTLLFIMSNTHLIALLLAFSLHLYFLLLNLEEKKKIRTMILHALFGAIVFFASGILYFPAI